MIEIQGVSKSFGKTKALNDVSFSVPDGTIFGLVGSNGAGKSTLIRSVAGVFQIDSGKILLNGREPFENVKVKSEIIYISDFPYFFPQSSIESMAKYYKTIYKNWSDDRFESLKKSFPIDSKMKIASMSKGMQRQAAILLGLSAMPKYLLFDEIFDGLDPVIRELVRKILTEYVKESGATVIIASHNLRELEDICSTVGFLHLGGILRTENMSADTLGMCRFQFILANGVDLESIKGNLNIVNEKHTGSVIDITARGKKDYVQNVIASTNPVFVEELPLTLEEFFIGNMEVAGYDINKIVK